jgi:hypothetical protein
MDFKTLVRLSFQDGNFIVPKEIVRMFGGNTAFLLAAFLGKDCFVDTKRVFDGKRYFEYVSSEIQSDCNLSYSQQKTAIQNLISIGVLSQKKLDSSLKLLFSLNYQKINELL